MNRWCILIAVYATTLVAARLVYSAPASAEYVAREAVVFLWHPTDLVRWHNLRRVSIDITGVVAVAVLLARGALSVRPVLHHRPE